ncbi:MAG: hypothetical protein JWP06_728 [Candidatus Saccharibacteria bacterium]|nr:hypothetical protein [Candidatus Saccharibacteria bacterium]
MTPDSTPESDSNSPSNPSLPQETSGFTESSIQIPLVNLTADEWLSALHSTEIKDKNQQIRLRPYFAGGMYILLVAQNVGIWLLIVWALQSNSLEQLQLIFSALIAGSLTQSYLIIKLITKKLFDDIDYHNGDSKK